MVETKTDKWLRFASKFSSFTKPLICCCCFFLLIELCSFRIQRSEEFFSKKRTHERNEPKTDKWLSCPSRFSPFNCCLSVFLLLDEGDYPDNSHAVLRPNI